MLIIENIETWGWEAAVRGCRNPKNSWHLSDSYWVPTEAHPSKPSDFKFVLGPNDLKLTSQLDAAGTEHRKFMRTIHVQFDVVAPTFWWAEFDTYKISTTRNSCSKMHKIHVKEFVRDDFSHDGCDEVDYASEELDRIIATCERLRQDFNRTGERKYWRALIELLPEGYNMRATWDGSFETVLNILKQRDNHKLKEEWGPICSKLLVEVPYLRHYYDVLKGRKDWMHV
jgi:hypothetical protein